MNKDNISAIVMAVAVVAIIVGFGIYFNSPALNKARSSQQLEKFISAATTTNGTIKTIKPREFFKDTLMTILKIQMAGT